MAAETQNPTKTVLVTGAAGYIGSHVAQQLLLAGHDVVGIDSLRSGSLEAIRRVEELGGKSFLGMEVGDIRDPEALDRCFKTADITDVIHLAGLKSVGESVGKPAMYYDVNVGGTAKLVEAMERHGVFNIVFSSSCTVYGDPSADQMPLLETSPLEPTNPYGRSKLTCERLLADAANSGPEWQIMSLRYFNPIGAHASGRIGEDQHGVPNNLLPYLVQVAVGERDELTVFGDDYPTSDGTCVRDYIHVEDLAEAHILALEKLESGFESVNLATGLGSTVLEVIDAVSKAVGRDVPYSIGDRRSGDASAVWADGSHALGRLGWKARSDLQDMCNDHWRWQEMNPKGYDASATDNNLDTPAASAAQG